MMYRIGGRLRKLDASLTGVDVGIPPFIYWNSNLSSNDTKDSVRWAV
jgi:hypothetical protein